MSCKLIIASLLLLEACSKVQGCPTNTALVTLQCRQDLAKGLKSKAQCYEEIEQSCR